MGKCAVVIVAAGRGRRVGSQVPKQYLQISGKPLIYHSILPFIKHAFIDLIRVVIHPNDLQLYKGATSGLDILSPVDGGETRQESVKLGLESLELYRPDHVLVHDGARPFIEESLITRVINALEGNTAVIPVIPVTDSIKCCGEDNVLRTLSKDTLRQAQTPQGFDYLKILAAHRTFAFEDLEDDCSVAELDGLTVKIIDGSPSNRKMTTSIDFEGDGSGMIERHTRTGFGFDVHQLKEGEKLFLCGIKIPFKYGLEGHSDADVGLHAITDALLGAAGQGDIGEHFPPSDEAWKGVSSEIFVGHAIKLIKHLGGKIINVDVIIICEAPKISPYRKKMRLKLSKLLEVTVDRVNIKASTTEKLGFTGRGEGICVQAIASVQMPVLETAKL